VELARLAGRDIQSCGYTYIPETHIHHLPHGAKALPFPFCIVFTATAGREGARRPLRLRSRCPKRDSHQTEQIISHVTQDPDLCPAQACLLSWICRVYRPFASCLRPLLPDAIASSRHLRSLTCPASLPFASFPHLGEGPGRGGAGGATFHPDARLALFLGEAWATMIGFSLLHVQTGAAELFLA
jgi:hypothetical protein